MTPRKELFIKIRDQLQTISQLEYIDLYRGQFEDKNAHYPDLFTAALIRINAITYEAMTQGVQEGKTSVDVLFYCKDGFADQFQNAIDPESGLMEIDLLDAIAEKLNFLSGSTFKPLQLAKEEPNTVGDIMGYTLTFDTTIYRQLGQSPTTKKPIKHIALKLI